MWGKYVPLMIKCKHGVWFHLIPGLWQWLHPPGHARVWGLLTGRDSRSHFLLQALTGGSIPWSFLTSFHIYSINKPWRDFSSLHAWKSGISSFQVSVIRGFPRGTLDGFHIARMSTDRPSCSLHCVNCSRCYNEGLAVGAMEKPQGLKMVITPNGLVITGVGDGLRCLLEKRKLASWSASVTARFWKQLKPSLCPPDTPDRQTWQTPVFNPSPAV